MDLYPPLSKELARKRAQLAPEISAAFKTFSQRVFAEGALPVKTITDEPEAWVKMSAKS